MGYMHINNLYKDQRILMFKECYALEKIHGTSAHVAWRDGQVQFFSGGEKHERFTALFDVEALVACLSKLGHPLVVIYGEAYGGSQQKQAHRYGDKLRFVAFDVQIGEAWLDVPQAHKLVTEAVGLEFVHYVRVATDLASLDAERDASSEQARRNSISTPQTREGVVLRPLVELIDKHGARVMAKHKRGDERETATPRKVVDVSQIEVLTRAVEIADEWVTPTRLEHVLDKRRAFGIEPGIEHMRDVISSMLEDVLREGADEIVDSQATRAAIAKKAAGMFKARLQAALRGGT